MAQNSGLTAGRTISDRVLHPFQVFRTYCVKRDSLPNHCLCKATVLLADMKVSGIFLLEPLVGTP